MENYRFKALEKATSRPVPVRTKSPRTSEIFGTLTFNKEAMKEFLAEDLYQQLQNKLENHLPIDPGMINQLANGLKSWAIQKGATHFTHWFQPLTGNTAEKHDSFLEIEKERAIEHFDGKQLTRQEPDASSLPSGGIRNTFEARGYSAWDPYSPAFIREDTLCIPSIFVSYTGESLDYKTPLLKSLNALDKAATEVMKYFDPETEKVTATLGIEQEYFLVDRSLYHARPDLALCGRTLFGHASAKDQQLDDHYFGVIPERVVDFMTELETEAYKIGIPVKTRHNEVAPNQFEFAPIFESVSLAIDHNQILMDLIEKVAERHNFKALLHEKPFANINGSGKHNNWSLMTNKGVNLLSPGKDEDSNFRFLAFFVNVIKAVYEQSDLLRASIASASNALRLGGNEAPPAIMSVFIGSYLTQMLEKIKTAEDIHEAFSQGDVVNSIFVEKIPEILIDNTDRNRTSPFAYTGNKFEFRAVGSSANSSGPMTVLNTAVAKQLKEFTARVEALIEEGYNDKKAILRAIKEAISEAEAVLFEGNNYGENWLEEATRRGLPHIQSTPEAIKTLDSQKARELFGEFGVLTTDELHARCEILMEEYVKKLQIESRVAGDIARNHIIPVAIQYQNRLIENVKGIKDLFGESAMNEMAAEQIKAIKKLADHLSFVQKAVIDMNAARKTANHLPELEDRAISYYNNVIPFMESIRKHVDRMELMVHDVLWPLPKYRELLFVR